MERTVRSSVKKPPLPRRVLRTSAPLIVVVTRTRPRAFWFGEVGVAVEALLAHVLAGLDAHQADVEPRVLVGGEREHAGDGEGPDGLVGVAVVDDGVSGADEDAGAGGGDLAALPR